MKGNKHFINKHIQDLEKLEKLLNDKLKLRIDKKPFTEAIKSLENCNCKQNICEYSINGLVLPMETTKHIKPKGISTLRLLINYKVKIDMSKWNGLEDPFVTYNFGVTLFGESNGNKYSFNWHIDRDNAPKSNEHHPLYHIHYSDGQTHLNLAKLQHNDEFSWGNAIFSDSPRLVHYPVDIILGIGFCLTNFFPKDKFKELRKDQFFTNIYRDSQTAILKPYFSSIASYWHTGTKHRNCNSLCPQLI